MGERKSWEGTASELLALIGDSSEGIPKQPDKLSSELMQDYITDPLESYGIAIQRERTAARRTLRLIRTLPSNYPTLPSKEPDCQYYKCPTRIPNEPSDYIAH